MDPAQTLGTPLRLNLYFSFYPPGPADSPTRVNNLQPAEGGFYKTL